MTERIVIPQLDNVVRAMNDLSRAQVEMFQRQEVLQDSIGQVAATGDRTRNELQQLAARFDDFALREELRHNLQVAHTEIIQVRQQLTTDFGKFAEVRQLAIGTLQALDTGIVSQTAIRQLSEELMLLTPGYWLAPALVALAAWIRDEPDLAYKALAEAVRRDNGKASLFFAMVLRRNQRDEATARWVRQYVVRQDPAKLSREFMVVLDAVSGGVFGHAAKPLVLAEIAEWTGRLCEDPAIVDTQVVRWERMLETLRRPVDPRYRILPVISPTWPKLKELYEGATVHGAALEHFTAVFDGPVALGAGLRQRVDEILDGLVKNFDTEEAPLRYREAELQSLIKADGNKTVAAQEMSRLDPAHEQVVDFLTMISNAVLHPETAGASQGTRRFAIASAKDWVVQAAGRLEVRNAAAMPPVVEVAIEGWTGMIDGSTDENQLAASLARHIDVETDRAVAQVRFTGKPLAFAIAAGVALVIALLAAVNGDAGTGAFFLAAVLALAGWSFYLARALPTRRAELRRQGEQRKAAAVDQLRGGIAELVDLHQDWRDQCAFAPGLRDYLEGLRATEFALDAPDQRRGI